MTYELIPPTEDFFSYQWYDRLGFGMTMMTEGLYSRIDSTRAKLNELEAKLGQRLDNDRYSPDLRSFLDRVGWLRGYIGVWTTDGERWDVQMAYPHTKRAISRWPDELFGERKEGNVLILLSSSVITWLNAIDKWVSSSYSTSTTTV
jgi:hypothetical protein